MHTAFLTGCATGFGFALARRLLSLGHRVVATDPDATGWPDRLGAPADRLLVLPLDVRDAAQVRHAAEQALAWGDVDVLVNNAGYAVFGSQEEADLEAVRELLDVNVLGVARVTQALLPSLRAHRGLVIQLSSVAGRTVFPESGYYAATKYAVEAMTEALFQETCTFGVRVRLIQPGAFDTCFSSTAAARSRLPPADSPYAPLRPGWTARKQAVLEPPQDPERVVDAIVGALDDPTPFRRIPVGPDAEQIIALRDALGPDAWSRLAGDRAGLVAPHGPGEVRSPAEVLELATDDPALEPARAALRHGHLDHWRDDPLGEQALAHLRDAPTES